tara:strand:- start:26 stop:658 length:633 start_codon:yes stop_codon:yes gene_type:complete
MSEKLEIYDLKGKLINIQERKKFYTGIKKEFDKKGKISKQVKSIRVLLLNSKGRIYLQKRARNKSENAGLYDKTVGGHVSAGDTFGMTLIRESAEELGFAAAVLSFEDFESAIKVTDLSIIGLFKKVDYITNFNSTRISKKGFKFIQPYMTSIFVGYYDGAIRFVDGESSGIEVFSLKELKDEIKNNPDKFTEDLKFMIKRYEKYLKPIK